MAEHIGAIHEGKKPFRCDICDYRCSQKSSLTRHIAQVHERKRPFKCEICDYSCSRKHMLNLFMKERSHSNVTFVTTAVLERIT